MLWKALENLFEGLRVWRLDIVLFYFLMESVLMSKVILYLPLLHSFHI